MWSEAVLEMIGVGILQTLYMTFFFFSGCISDRTSVRNSTGGYG